MCREVAGHIATLWMGKALPAAMPFASAGCGLTTCFASSSAARHVRLAALAKMQSAALRRSFPECIRATWQALIAKEWGRGCRGRTHVFGPRPSQQKTVMPHGMVYAQVQRPQHRSFSAVIPLLVCGDSCMERSAQPAEWPARRWSMYDW